MEIYVLRSRARQCQKRKIRSKPDAPAFWQSSPECQRDQPAPVLLNSWEAFEFDMNDENCLELEKEAAKAGGKLFVVDDGWFRNRNDDTKAPGSFYLESGRQRELSHKYMLGLYSILERLNRKFPEVLFEGCSSGGGRFDAGMLYYMPQTWTSDNTDAVCRLLIQYGTSLLFPPPSGGGNRGDQKADCLLQTYPRSDPEGKILPASESAGGKHGRVEFCPGRRKCGGFLLFRILSDAVRAEAPVKLYGFQSDSIYCLEPEKTLCGGDELMYAWITPPSPSGDFTARICVFRRTSVKIHNER